MTHDRRYETIEPHDGKWIGETYVFQQRVRKARKQHLCHHCSEPIEPKTRYVVLRTRDTEAPGWEEWAYHGECYLAEELPYYGNEKRPDWRWEG